MNKKLLLSLLLGIFLISFINAGLCYQETANVATSCGGLGSGSYGYTILSGDVIDINNWKDGDYGTSATKSGSSSTAFLYANYTRPNGVTGAVWQVVDNQTSNLTIPSLCINQVVQLRVNMTRTSPIPGNSEGTVLWDCYNGSDFINLRNSGLTTNYASVSEEAMYWDINNSAYLKTPVNNSYLNYNNVNLTAALFSGANMSNYTLKSYTNLTYSLCYQESANTTNQNGNDGSCSLNYTGNYYTSNTTYLLSGCGSVGTQHSNAYDGNWGSCLSPGSYGSVYYNVNYSKPIGSIGAILSWKFSASMASPYGNQSMNITLPLYCLGNDIVSINMNSTLLNVGGHANSEVKLSCYNGTWNQFYSLYSAYIPTTTYVYSIFEEGIYWNISSQTLYNQTTIITSSNPTSTIIGTLVNLIDGVYTWFYEVFDIDNNQFVSENFTLTVDTTFPQIDFGVGTLGSGVNVSQSNIYINTTWTEINFANITFDIFDSFVPESRVTSLVPLYKINSTGKTDGIYYYNVTICDLANNCNTTSTRKITLDTTGPNITIISPINGTYSNSTNINFTANISDATAGIKNATLYIFNNHSLCYQESANATNQNNNDGACELNYTGSYTLSGTWYNTAGFFIKNIYDGNWSSPAAGNTLGTINIVYIKPKNFNNATWQIKYGNSSTIYQWNMSNISVDSSCLSYSDINLSLSITSKAGAYSYWYCKSSNGNILLFNDTRNSGGDVIEEGIYWTVTYNKTTNNYNNPLLTTIGIVVNLIDGIYNWVFEVIDAAGNYITSNSNTLTVDTTSPTITITYPLSQTYLYNITELNYTVSGTNLDKCWFNNSIVAAGVNFTLLNSSEGSNTWVMYCNNSAGAQSSKNVTFTKYSITPTITVINPLNNNFTKYNNLVQFEFVTNLSVDTLQSLKNQTLFIYNASNSLKETKVIDISNYGRINQTRISYSFPVEGQYPYTDYIWKINVCGNISLCTTTPTYNLSIYEDDIALEGILLSKNKLLDNMTFMVNFTSPRNNYYSYCNFTIKNPANNILINNINGTKYNERFWNSSYFIPNQTGVYNVSYYCLDKYNRTSNYFYEYNITYTSTLNPLNYTFAAINTKTETNIFNISIYDDIDSEIAYNITYDIEQLGNFTIALSNYNISLNQNDNSTNPVTITFNITASSIIANGSYSGNITFSNSTYGITKRMSFTYGISPPAGLPTLYDSSGISTCLSSGGLCYKSFFLKMGGAQTLNYQIKNTGFYQMSECNMYLDNSFTNYSNWVSFSNSNFSLAINEVKNISMTFSPYESYLSTGLYTGNFYITCNNGDLVGNPQSVTPDNRPGISLTVFARDPITTFTGTGGGGSGGYTPAPVVTVGNGTWTFRTEERAGAYTLQMIKESTRIKNLELISTASEEIKIKLSCDGELCKYINLTQTDIVLPVNKEYVTLVQFVVTLPSDIKDGEYLNNIIATDQFGNKAIVSVNINVGSDVFQKAINKILTNKMFGSITVPYLLIFFGSFAIISILIYIVILKIAPKFLLGPLVAFFIGLISAFLILLLS